MSKSITFVPRSSNGASRRGKSRRNANAILLGDFMTTHGKKTGANIPKKQTEEPDSYKFRKQPMRKSQKKVTFNITSNKNPDKKMPRLKSRPVGTPPLHPRVISAKNIENSLEMEKAVMFRNTRRRMANADTEINRLRQINQEIMGDLCECCNENNEMEKRIKENEKFIQQASDAISMCEAIYRDAFTIIQNNKKPVIEINEEGFMRIISENK